ncbi:MAG: hypothetical protein KatS3mg104_1815 [Phycisphaerae bacterium]|mgnify:CR=1 FL=1|jgi:hypothetical protein|nr:MAG: hypothetical protein KatS3mg104_1815 [Phycisphaerae bacterium]
MPHPNVDPIQFAERHRAALYHLVDHILTHAGAIYTSDFEEQVKEVIDTFDAYAGRTIGFEPQHPDDGLDHAYRSHSFVTAQGAALLVFAHAATRMAVEGQNQALRALVDALWTEIDRLYRQFFDTVPPYLAPGRTG